MKPAILTILLMWGISHPLFSIDNGPKEKEDPLTFCVAEVQTRLEAWGMLDPRGRFDFDTLPEESTRVIEFKAVFEGQDVAINWSTDAEYLLDYFELYQSIDYEPFKSLVKIKEKDGKKEGKNKHYKYLDKAFKDLTQTPKKVKYRLNAVTTVGSESTVAQTSLAVSGEGTPDDITDLLPQITPKSPNVAAMERFGTYPVSLYTGLPQIDIPIYNIKVGDMTIPIKLSYHAGGNKVLDNASWVGLGWTVTGLYSVTREVRGLIDENGGLYDDPLPNFPTPQPTCLTEALKDR